ncbi:TonB-dependent receptor family protein [Flavilitoribacter nigricans]|uniref:TonB-dependent receptor n=1 Tax=Flavilitoribacter nigricans (strain ATCC 23147 / DSM 23189 / NBRC 102662 / NCIMB 1420 / SS-2) TaxID=1122177 RepID=A0A2D0N778_FLAN2|nr:TonB-dependent receptor [Flavilitoribacter nigricans]PHN03623.1 TonB-dependent receptor [Flavilitoribacter nigricans DSM 23189 = NBRC 102662]
MMKIIYPLAFLLSFTHFSLAQQADQVYGKILTEEGAPLIGATVVNIRTAAGSVSDPEGSFSVDATRGDTLRFSFLGYSGYDLVWQPEMDLPLRIRLSATPTLLDVDFEVQGARIPVEANTPAPIMTLHPEDLLRDDRTSIRPALNRVPGVLMHSGALNTNRITIRGIGNRSPFSTAKIRAYFNDIPLTNGVGETTLEDIDLSLVDEVSIWKGPTASTYGAGLGGMIHLKSSPDYAATGIRGQVEGTYGSFGTRRLAAGLQFTPDNPQSETKWNAKLHYHNMHSDGYRANGQYDRQGLAFLANHQTRRENTTTLLVNYIDLKAFIPSSLNRDDYLNEPTKAAFTWAQVMGFEDSQKLIVGVSHKHHLVRNGNEESVLENTSSVFGTWYENYESRPFNILSEKNEAVGGRTRFVFHPSANPAFSLQAGAELFVENYDWQTYRTDGGRQDTLLSDNTELRTYYNLFLESHLQLGSRFRIAAGVNVNQTRYELTDRFLVDNIDISGDYRFANIISPRLGLLYRLPRELNLFGNISHGFAQPTLEETLTPEGSINPEIQPEKGWNFELGLRRNSPAYRLNFEITAYSMPVRDLLVARRTALDQYVGINAGKTLHQGVEAYVQYKLSDPFSVFANYTYAHYRFQTFVDGENDYSGNELTGTPPHLFNIGLDYNPSGEGFYSHLNYGFVDAMPIRDDNTAYSEAYGTMNLKLGYKKTVGMKAQHPVQLNLFGGINNLLDEKYAAMIQVNAGSFGGAAPRYYYPGLPRNFYIGLRLSLGDKKP